VGTRRLIMYMEGADDFWTPLPPLQPQEGRRSNKNCFKMMPVASSLYDDDD